MGLGLFVAAALVIAVGGSYLLAWLDRLAEEEELRKRAR